MDASVVRIAFKSSIAQFELENYWKGPHGSLALEKNWKKKIFPAENWGRKSPQQDELVHRAKEAISPLFGTKSIVQLFRIESCLLSKLKFGGWKTVEDKELVYWWKKNSVEKNLLVSIVFTVWTIGIRDAASYDGCSGDSQKKIAPISRAALVGRGV